MKVTCTALVLAFALLAGTVGIDAPAPAPARRHTSCRATALLDGARHGLRLAKRNDASRLVQRVYKARVHLAAPAATAAPARPDLFAVVTMAPAGVQRELRPHLRIHARAPPQS